MKQENNNRLYAIDGMRGIAAFGVVLFHLSGNLKEELSQLLPEFIVTFFAYGFLGVPIFFVISGFVIALSVGNRKVTRQYATQFIIRRSIRLDLTYWASIALAIVLVIFKNKFLGYEEPTPSAGNVLAHMFYLQDILQVEPIISVVYWTLCLEVQFYLFYLFTLWLSQVFANNSDKEFLLHLCIIISVGIFSVLINNKILSLPIPGIFVGYWHYFLLGVLVYHTTLNKKYSSYLLAAWIIFEIIIQASTEIRSYVVAAIIASAFIFCLIKTNSLNTTLTHPILQYLGKISYTLYLIHPDIGWKTISVGRALLGDYMSPVLGGVLMIVGIIASIIAAHIFHLLFESPCLLLCKKLKKQKLREVIAEFFNSRNRASRASGDT